MSWIQFGCGLSAPAGWKNYDSSVSLWLQRIPVLGSLMPGGAFGRFPLNARFGDIVRGLPEPPGEAEFLYSSHVLEHLSLADLRQALRNCRGLLQHEGVFRMVVPDLEHMIDAYRNDSTPQAASCFIHATRLGFESRPRGFRAAARSCLGNSRHLWMWDFKGLAAELSTAGFTNIRRAQYGDSGIDAFRLVEDPTRWDGCLGIQCS
jgi:hypothetical protein